MAERIRLVVLFGGRSAEHEVSCTTAVNVLPALGPARYDVGPAGATRGGGWVLAEGAAKALAAGVEGDLGWPVSVKPSNLGPAVGVTKVRDAGELDGARGVAFAYDEWALVEEAIAGREIECGVLGDPPEASLPGEIRPSHEFYDYEDKYLVDGAELLVPAPLSATETATVQALALAAFAAVEAEAMARVDF